MNKRFSDKRITGFTSHSVQRVNELMWPNTTTQLTQIINEVIERLGVEPIKFIAESQDPVERLQQFIEQLEGSIPTGETGSVERSKETNGLQVRLIGDVDLTVSYKTENEVLYLAVMIHCEGFHPEERAFMDHVLHRLAEIDPIAHGARTMSRTGLSWESSMKF